MTRLPVRSLAWVFTHPAAVATLSLVVLHQSLIASSAYFLTQTITRYQAGQAFQSDLVLYFLAMILPFIPGCLSCVTTQYWINTVHRNFSLAMTSAMYGKQEIYRSATRKTDFDSAISRNSFSVISTYITLFHDFLSLALNSILSIAVIGLILPAEIALGYLISLVLSVSLVTALSKRVRSQSVQAEQHFSNYGTVLHKAWDNITLGNAYNARRWRAEFDAHGSAYYTATQKLSIYKQLGNLSVALAYLIPTAFLVYHLLVFDTLEASIVAAIIVNLTRIFHILNSLSALVYEVIEWSSATARLRYLFAFLTPAPAEKLPTSPVGKVTVNGEPVTDYATVLETLRHQHCGRVTIRGDNGAGKSTLLLSIKQAFPEKALLLPAGGQLLSWAADHASLSTGQRARAILDELVMQDAIVQYLLLDEWDANLDQENRKLVDELLDVVSQNRVVVEVRH